MFSLLIRVFEILFLLDMKLKPRELLEVLCLKKESPKFVCSKKILISHPGFLLSTLSSIALSFKLLLCTKHEFVLILLLARFYRISDDYFFWTMNESLLESTSGENFVQNENKLFGHWSSRRCAYVSWQCERHSLSCPRVQLSTRAQRLTFIEEKALVLSLLGYDTDWSRSVNFQKTLFVWKTLSNWSEKIRQNAVALWSSSELSFDEKHFSFYRLWWKVTPLTMVDDDERLLVAEWVSEREVQ